MILRIEILGRCPRLSYVAPLGLISSIFPFRSTALRVWVNSPYENHLPHTIRFARRFL